jgi:hypothetical protein
MTAWFIRLTLIIILSICYQLTINGNNLTTHNMVNKALTIHRGVDSFNDMVDKPFDLIASSSNLPLGSNVPDVSFVTLDGNQHYLYDYLNDGKFIILDLFWVGCSPCWNYYQSGHLQEIYSQLGPEGTDEVQVFAVETSQYSGDHCLYGPAGMCQTNNLYTYTYGNFVENANYPIANSDIGSAFKVKDYPNYYILYPNGTLKRIPSPKLKDVKTLIQNYNDSQGLFGANNVQLLNMTSGLIGDCTCESDSISPQIEFRNLGTQNLTSIEFSIYNYANHLYDYQWNGNLEPNQTMSINIPKNYFGENGTLKVNAHQVNGKIDDQDSNNELTMWIDKPRLTKGPGFQAVIEINTNAERLYWEFSDTKGNVVSTGGNPMVGPDGSNKFDLNNPIPVHPDAYLDSVEYEVFFYPPSPGCYRLKLIDGYGMGISYKVDDSHFYFKELPPHTGSVGAIGYTNPRQPMYSHIITPYGSIDKDQDGYPYEVDCDDQNPDIHPDAAELCDGEDNNCNGLIDDEDPMVQGNTLWYLDSDGDGFGNPEIMMASCHHLDGFVNESGDCNDDDPNVFPGAKEIPNNGIDEDCDGEDLFISSVQDELLDELIIYPNPSTGVFTLAGYDVSDFTFSILNYQGTSIGNIYPRNNELNLDFVPNGIYMLLISDKFGRSGYKVISIIR